MQTVIFERNMQNMASDAYMINARTRLLDLERLHKSITIHYHCRRFIDKYRCIDTPREPLTLNNYVLHGGLIYYKADRHNWITVSMDDIDLITLEEV